MSTSILKLVLLITMGAFLLASGCAKAQPNTPVGNVITSDSPNHSTNMSTNNTQAIIATGNFRSESNHFAVDVPPGWAATEGNYYLARPFQGLVTFNSWDQTGFWAPEEINGNSRIYSPLTIARQIPNGGAYVVLIEVGGPPRIEPPPPEFPSTNLESLWEPHDARHDGGRTVGFRKWGTDYRLDIYCSPDASEAVVSELNALLQSFSFDSFPSMDPAWAEQQARHILPDVVGSIEKIEMEDLGGIANFQFLYDWYTEGDYRRHYWEVEVLPTGKVTIIWEAGANLP